MSAGTYLCSDSTCPASLFRNTTPTCRSGEVLNSNASEEHSLLSYAAPSPSSSVIIVNINKTGGSRGTFTNLANIRLHGFHLPRDRRRHTILSSILSIQLQRRRQIILVFLVCREVFLHVLDHLNAQQRSAQPAEYENTLYTDTEKSEQHSRERGSTGIPEARCRALLQASQRLRRHPDTVDRTSVRRKRGDRDSSGGIHACMAAIRRSHHPPRHRPDKWRSTRQSLRGHGHCPRPLLAGCARASPHGMRAATPTMPMNLARRSWETSARTASTSSRAHKQIHLAKEASGVPGGAPLRTHGARCRLAAQT